jgi:uncharacterized protein (DUF1015 family)
MVTVRSFRGLRPASAELASKIASPPYDVIDSDEARKLAEGNEHSFLHVVKPEIDLPESTDLYADEVYATGKKNLDMFREKGWLVQDEKPGYYVYRLTWRGRSQTGVIGCASADDYEAGRIKKHEHTRPAKEDDRTRHVDEQSANCGPVFLAYRADDTLDAIATGVSTGPPEYDFTAPDGVRHEVWVVQAEDTVESIRKAFEKIPATYVADGHHRTASGWRVAKLRRERNPDFTGDEESNFFLAVHFPHDQLRILDYNRAVANLNGLTAEDFLSKVSEKFEIEDAEQPEPYRVHDVSMYFEGKWNLLRAKEDSYEAGHPIRGLDIDILQQNLLAPVLGIDDPRTNDDIKFVGGIRGTEELERLVDSGQFAVAFAMFPVTLDQLMAVADAGEIMPPKATWFEPKLRSGLVIHLLD